MQVRQIKNNKTGEIKISYGGLIKRIALITLVVIFIAFVVLIGFFKNEVSTSIVSSVIDKIENRLLVEISFESIDTSFSGLSIKNALIKGQENENKFAKFGEIVVDLKLLPILWGEIKISKINLDKFEIKISSEDNWAQLNDWVLLLKKVPGTKNQSSNEEKTSVRKPLINILSGTFEYKDEHLGFSLEGIKGMLDPKKNSVFTFMRYLATYNDSDLIKGENAKLNYFSETRKATLELPSPRFIYSSDMDSIVFLSEHISKLYKNIFTDLTSPESIKSRSLHHEDAISARVSIHNAFLKTPGEVLISDEIGAIINIETDKSAKINFEGSISPDKKKWSLTVQVKKDMNVISSLEIPLFPLIKIAPLISGVKTVAKDETSLAKASIMSSYSKGRNEISFNGQVSFEKLNIEHKNIASVPVDKMDFNLDFSFDYSMADNLIKLVKLSAFKDIVRADISGIINTDKLGFDLLLNIPVSSCQTILKTIPRQFRQKIKDVSLSGNLALNLRLAIDEEDPESTNLDVMFDNGCHIQEWGELPAPGYFKGPFAYVTYSGSKKDLRLVTGPGTDRWTLLSEISPYVVEAILTTEDGKFFRHKGVTIPEIQKAIEINLTKKSFKYGASTITMQLAKNLFLSREKTVARKLSELFFVWYLETNFSKETILELYLNVVEFGPSIYGIRDAAMHYFGLEPKELNIAESVFLVWLLPSPVRRHKAWERGEITPRQRAIINRILLTMKSRERLTPEEYVLGLEQEVVFVKEGDLPRPPRPPVKRDMFFQDTSNETYEDVDDENDLFELNEETFEDEDLPQIDEQNHKEKTAEETAEDKNF